MSGGGFLYIQNHDAEAFLNDAQLVDELQRVARALVDYGEEGKAVRHATASLHGKLMESRQAYLKLLEELDDLIRPLRPVWKMMDYHGALDVSKEDVSEALRDYNTTHSKEPSP